MLPLQKPTLEIMGDTEEKPCNFIKGKVYDFVWFIKLKEIAEREKLGTDIQQGAVCAAKCVHDWHLLNCLLIALG